MKFSSAVFATIASVLLSISNLSAQEEPTVIASPYGSASGNGTGHTLFPEIEGRRFEVINGTAGTEVNIACDGVNVDGVLDGMVDQYEAIFENLMQNWASMGVNYLVYSSPTLYSLLDDLNNTAEFNMGMTMDSCNSLRSRTKSRTQDLIDAAINRCIEDRGASDSYCNDASNYQEYIDDARIEEAEESQESSLAAIDDCEGENCVSTGNIEKGNTRDHLVALAKVDKDDRENIKAVLDYIEVDDDGETSYKKAGKTLHETIREMRDKYKEALNDLVNMATSGKNDTWTASDEYRFFQNKSNKAPSASDISSLAELSKNDPYKYESKVDIISNEQAMTYGRWLINRLEMAILNYTNPESKTGGKISKSTRNFYKNVALPDLKMEMDHFEDMVERQREEAKAWSSFN